MPLVVIPRTSQVPKRLVRLTPLGCWLVDASCSDTEDSASSQEALEAHSLGSLDGLFAWQGRGLCGCGFGGQDWGVVKCVAERGPCVLDRGGRR
jgi:hypothetical protein